MSVTPIKNINITTPGSETPVQVPIGGLAENILMSDEPGADSVKDRIENIQILQNIKDGEGYRAIVEGAVTSGTYDDEDYTANVASGAFSHAEGYMTIASKTGTHAEGKSTLANGSYSHAEGYKTTANEYSSHAEGKSTLANGSYSHAEGSSTTASCDYSHAEGFKTIASEDYSHAEGHMTTASGKYSHTEGIYTIASNYEAHAEGEHTTASGDSSHAEGTETIARGQASHAEGQNTTASGPCSHAEGQQTLAIGYDSHAEGYATTAKGIASHAAGRATIANTYQTVVGQSNAPKGYEMGYTANSGYFIVGSDSSSNCFRATETNTYGKTYATSGADYAEMFEWLDGNPNNEDRTGKFVTLKGMKISLATSLDTYILGIVSRNASIIGDVYDDQWQGMFETDIFGGPIYEKQEHTLEDGTKVYDDVLKINPNYDNTQTYIPRSERPEWSAIGLVGKIVCLDDGTGIVDEFVKVNNDSIATHSDEPTKYRVMERLDENHIRIMIL